MHRKAVLRECERRLQYIGERHRAELGERGHQSIQGGRNSRGEQARMRHQLQSERQVVRDRRARRRHHVAVKGDHAACSCRVDEHRGLTADGMHVRIYDTFDKGSGDCGIDRITASREGAGPGRSGEVVLGRDHDLASHHHRIDCRHLRIPHAKYG